VSAWEIRGPWHIYSKGNVAIISIIIATTQTFLVLSGLFGVGSSAVLEEFETANELIGIPRLGSLASR
jgi:hypothetical protein